MADDPARHDGTGREPVALVVVWWLAALAGAAVVRLAGGLELDSPGRALERLAGRGGRGKPHAGWGGAADVPGPCRQRPGRVDWRLVRAAGIDDEPAGR